MSETDKSLAIACTRAREAAVRRFQPVLSKENLTEQQWRTLRILYEEDSIHLAALCRRCCIHKVSMARIIRHLMERDLVCRMRSTEDRRAYVVALTQKGRTHTSEISQTTNRIHNDLESDFGLEKTQQLLSLLAELAAIDSA